MCPEHGDNKGRYSEQAPCDMEPHRRTCTRFLPEKQHTDSSGLDEGLSVRGQEGNDHKACLTACFKKMPYKKYPCTQGSPGVHVCSS